MKSNREINLRRVDELGPITDGCRRLKLPGEHRMIAVAFWLLGCLAGLDVLLCLAGAIILGYLNRG